MTHNNLVDIPADGFAGVFDTKDVLSWMLNVYYDEENGRETVTLLAPHPTEQHELARAHAMYANRDARFRSVPARSLVFRGTFAEVLQVLAREIDPDDRVADAFAHLYDSCGLNAPDVVELVDPPAPSLARQCDTAYRQSTDSSGRPADIPL